MYNSWTVIFRIDLEKRGPRNPVLRSEPPVQGSVGDVDPFSDAFGEALYRLDTSNVLPKQEDATSIDGDVIELISSHSSVLSSPASVWTQSLIQSPSTLCTQSSTQSPSEVLGQTPYQHLPPWNECKVSRRTPEGCLSGDLALKPRTNNRIDPAFECPDRGEINQSSAHALITAFSVAAKSTFDSGCKPERGTTMKKKCKRGRRRSSASSGETREKFTSREQHLALNKEAARKCRENRKAWEEQLKERSALLSASINASRREIVELESEVAMLQQQVRERQSQFA